MHVSDILESCIYVDDLDAAEAFYCRVLGLTLVSRRAGRHVFLRCGNRMLLIFDPQASRDNGGNLPPHGTDGSGHLAFAVPEKDLDRWKQSLNDVGVQIEQEIEWPQGGRSLYFRDPAGNSLELATPKIWGMEEQTIIA